MYSILISGSIFCSASIPPCIPPTVCVFFLPPFKLYALCLLYIVVRCAAYSSHAFILVFRCSLSARSHYHAPPFARLGLPCLTTLVSSRVRFFVLYAPSPTLFPSHVLGLLSIVELFKTFAVYCAGIEYPQSCVLLLVCIPLDIQCTCPDQTPYKTLTFTRGFVSTTPLEQKKPPWMPS
jgi:hypothetical protein